MPEEPEIEMDEDEDLEEDHEQEEEEAENADEVLANNFAHDEAEIAEANANIANIAVQVDAQLVAMIEIDEADADAPVPGSAALARIGEETPRGLDKLLKQVVRYRQDHVALQRQRGRIAARAAALSATLGTKRFGKTPVEYVFTVLAAIDSSGIRSQSPVEATTKATINDLLVRWRAISDEKNWQAFANHCDKHNPSLQAQILGMDTVIRLAAPLPAGTPLPSDAASRIDSLLESYKNFRSTISSMPRSAALYRTAASFPYPRATVAVLLQLVLTEIALQARKKQ